MDNEFAIKQRIEDCLKVMNLTINKVSHSEPAIQVRLSRQINGDASLSCQTIMYILDSLECISAEWLLRGKGEMFITQGEPKNIQVGDKNVNVQNDKDIITLLIEQNKHLQDASKEKTAQIDRLLALLSNR